MTIREKMSRMLVDRGMWPRDAETIIDQYVAENNGVDNRVMSEDETSYPLQMLDVIFMGLKMTTVAWIDANCPKHWARPLFTDDAELRSA